MPILWTDSNGKLCVMRLDCAYVERNRLPGETTAQAVTRLAEIVKAKVPTLKDATPKLLPSSEMPKDRTLRNEWKLVGNDITDSKGVVLEKTGDTPSDKG
jgi:hypothetical protein